MEISPLVSRQGEILEHYFRMNPNLSLPLHVISAAEQSRDFVIDNSANGDPWGPLARHNSRLHILQEDSILQKLESQRIFSIGPAEMLRRSDRSREPSIHWLVMNTTRSFLNFSDPSKHFRSEIRFSVSDDIFISLMLASAFRRKMTTFPSIHEV